MKAYAILEGGGVKGAALAGCLVAGKKLGIEFIGYGGTSAGAMIALLASLGYSDSELEHLVVDETDFNSFLDDGGTLLKQTQAAVAQLSGGVLAKFRTFLNSSNLLELFRKDFGLYDAPLVESFLLQHIKKKFPSLQSQAQVTFRQLIELGCPPLKVVASDLFLRQPRVSSAAGGDELDGSVTEAVRASMSYPFVFKPVKLHNRYLVDGGLTTNMPLFLFETERRENGFPVVAFDLVSRREEDKRPYDFKRFCADMLATSLDSNDYLLRKLVDGVYSVEVPIDGIETLDFDISRAQRRQLFVAGQSATFEFFSKVLPHWMQASGLIEHLQATYAEPHLVEPVLRSLAKDIEQGTGAKQVRANVMLPTGGGRLIVTYQFRMGGDPDVDLEISFGDGPQGKCWQNKKPILGDWAVARQNPTEWNLRETQVARVKNDRVAVFCVPIFRPEKNAKQAQIAGVLSVDTTSSLNDSLWKTERADFAARTMLRWSDILSKVLH